MRELTKLFDYSMSAPRSILERLSNGFGNGNSGEGKEHENSSPGQIEEFLDILYLAGDQLQRDFIGAGLRFFEPTTWTPSGIARTTAEFTSMLAESVRFVEPSENGLTAWRELGNKVEIFRLVKQSKAKLGVPSGRFPLHQYVDKAYGLGAFPALWAVEGLGHDYAAAFRPYSKTTRGMLTDPSLDPLPAKSMTMLHAGIGLGFAEDLIKSVHEDSSASDVRRMLDFFIRLCRENSRPGFEGCALESLGLVTRTWHRNLMSLIDEHIMTTDQVAAAYFWRGAGRALYFLPINFLPGYGSVSNSIRMSKLESPHQLARRNTLAGIAWALTVVNMLQPSVMESFLRRHGDEYLGQEAFANGVMSSIVMRNDTTPGEAFIRDFISYKPAGSDSHAVELWDVLIRIPGEDAVTKVHPVLRDNHRLGEVFRCQPLTTLASDLKARSGEAFKAIGT